MPKAAFTISQKSAGRWIFISGWQGQQGTLGLISKNLNKLSGKANSSMDLALHIKTLLILVFERLKYYCWLSDQNLTKKVC